MYAISMRILNNQAEAEDCVQEVYERAWKHIESIEEGDAKAWLAKTTRNRCIDKLRAKRPNEALDTAPELECQALHNSSAIEHQQLSGWFALRHRVTQRAL